MKQKTGWGETREIKRIKLSVHTSCRWWWVCMNRMACSSVIAAGRWTRMQEAKTAATHAENPATITITYILHRKENILFNHSKTKNNLNCMCIFNTYRAVNTQRLDYKNHIFTEVSGNNVLTQRSIQRYKYVLFAECRIFRLFRKIAKIDYQLRHVSVCSSIRTKNPGSQNKDFHEIWYLNIFRNRRWNSSFLKIR
jgi:hypothetical protein